MSKKLIVLLASIGLVLVLVLSGCGQATTGGGGGAAPAGPATDKVYRCLNPLGQALPVELVAMPPRIDKLEGKKIAFIQTEADPVLMPALWDRLQKDYPTVTWVKTVTNSTTALRMTAEEQKGVQAAIVGVAW